MKQIVRMALPDAQLPHTADQASEPDAGEAPQQSSHRRYVPCSNAVASRVTQAPASVEMDCCHIIQHRGTLRTQVGKDRGQVAGYDRRMPAAITNLRMANKCPILPGATKCPILPGSESATFSTSRKLTPRISGGDHAQPENTAEGGRRAQSRQLP